MWNLKRWRQRRIVERAAVPESAWQEAETNLFMLRDLNDEELGRLRQLAVLFLHDKAIEGAQGLVLDDTIRLRIALQACLPILGLGLDWYDGWHAVIVYPGGFVTEHEEVDEAGVVHLERRALSGEAWTQGPVIISWEDAAYGGLADGHNLIIHEFAHKLDMLNGAPNGQPPLHRDMSLALWTSAFAEAFADFEVRVTRGEYIGIDPYAAEAPAEFFAVLSEVFFEAPTVVLTHYPRVYAQLKSFYRQDPIGRLQFLERGEAW